jgi:hypothetical protein
MRRLLFLSRLAFICGFFFILSASLLIRDWAQDQAVVSTIIIIGQVMGVILVPLVCICYLVVLFWKRTLTAYVPLWLVMGNVLFLVILGMYIFLQYG